MKPSKVDKLPGEIRELIGDLRRRGHTLDAIMGKLRELPLDPADLPSRSGLGRHIAQLDQVAEELRRQKVMAEALVERGLMVDGDQTARLNIGLAHAVLTKLALTEDGGVAALDAEEAMFLSRSVQSLVSAAKTDTDRTLKLRAEMAREAADAAAKVAKDQGLTREAVDEITRQILGLAK